MIAKCALLWLAVVLCTACTRTITSGTYGPLHIGADKSMVMAVLESSKLYDVEPLPSTKLYIDHLTSADLKTFREGDGILITVNQHPFPLRIEFSQGKVSKTWPTFGESVASLPEMRQADSQLADLQRSIPVGTSRSDVYSRISSFASSRMVSAGNFVVGYQTFRENGIPVPWTEAFKALLLNVDTWKFEGLGDQLWYRAFYSTVTLYFKDDKLVHIEHFHFPFELL